MTTPPAAHDKLVATAGPTLDTERAPAPSRRELLAWMVLALVPASVLVALLVLHLMSASAAAATGGCGGP